MFHKKQDRLSVVSKVIQKKQNSMNEEIFIQDIFVFPEKSSLNRYGECDFVNENSFSYSTTERLVDLIESLANMTNIIHLKSYYQKTGDSYVQDDEHKNKITRLLLPEFSLYTYHPLRLSIFELLLESITLIAKNQNDNVHLLLSSFSVITNDRKILNMCVYVQCGEEPIINVFCKSTPSTVDIRYSNTMLFSKFNNNNLKDCSDWYNIHPHYFGVTKSFSISANSVFLIKLKNSHAAYLQAVDICLAHEYSQSRKLIEYQIFSNAENDTHLIPDQVDHVLTSNSQHEKENAKLSKHIVHIDPYKTPLNVDFEKNDLVDAVDLNQIKKNKYPTMCIEECGNGFILKNPCFGPDYVISIHSQRKLDLFKDDLKAVVDAKNKAIANKLCDVYLNNGDDLSVKQLRR